MQGLQGILAGRGNPIDQTPAWQAMVAAQQRNIDEGRAALQAQFDVSGNRFSTAFGTAATDYENQARLNQNALLGQMTAQAGENAQQRMLSAAGQLGQFGYGAGSQLSSQDFQSQMQQYNAALQAAMAMGQGADVAGSQLAGFGAQGANALLGASMAGAQGLFGAENQAAQSMFGAQNAMTPQYMQYLLGSQQQGLQGAADLSNLWNQNLGMGAQLGGQQYNLLQSQINNAYQQWLYQQPQNNPLLSMMYSAATSFPSPVYPGYQPGALGGILGGLGSLAGGVAAFSDERLKDNIEQIGDIQGLPLVSYNWKDDPNNTPQVGFIAQDVAKKFPQAVIPGSKEGPGHKNFTPWMIQGSILGQLLSGGGGPGKYMSPLGYGLSKLF
jgi:hypothetical protein